MVRITRIGESESKTPSPQSIFSRLRREIFQICSNLSNLFFYSFSMFCDLANSDYCFCPLGRTDLFDLEWFVRFLREAHSFFQSSAARTSGRYSLVAYGEKSFKSIQIFQIFFIFFDSCRFGKLVFVIQHKKMGNFSIFYLFDLVRFTWMPINCPGIYHEW